MRPHLLHVFSTFAPGGPQVRTVRMIDAFGDAYRHTVLAMDGRAEARELLADPRTVELLEPPPGAGSLRTMRAMRRVLASVRPDLLLTYNWGAIESVVAAKSLGLSGVLHHEDGFLPDEAEGFKRRREVARRFALPWTSGVVVPSHRLRRIAIERWRLPEDHVRLIPNGVRIEDFPRRDGNAALRAQLGIPADAFVVGAVGHLRREKNMTRLVEALAAMEHTDAHLLLLGDGPERASVEAARDRAGLGRRLHLLGHRDEPGPYLRAMDAFSISSDTEQMPVALLEAMASALAVASTDVGDVRTMLPPEQGDFVVACDPAALARALEGLRADPGRRVELGEANRERAAERYGFEGMLAGYDACYRRALSAQGRPSS